jgi:fatty acid desaturase
MEEKPRQAAGSRDRLNPRLLSQSNLHGYVQVFGNVALYLTLIVLASRTRSAWLMAPLIGAIGVACHRLFFPLHDCLHYSLFRSRRANAFFGHVIAGLIGTPFTPFRDQHLAHHRDFATPEDPGAEDYQVRFANRRQLVAFLVAPLVGATFVARLVHYVRRLGQAADRKAGAPKGSTPLTRKLMELSILMLVQAGVCALLTRGFRPAELWRYAVFGVLPLITVFLFLNRLRMFLEHASLDYSKSDYVTVWRPIARTIYATPWEKFLLSGGNFNYHHEHHLYPIVPGCNLPTLHHELKPSIDPDEIRLSYLQALIEIWRNISPKNLPQPLADTQAFK